MQKLVMAAVILISSSVAVADDLLDEAQSAIREGNFAEAYCLMRPLAEQGNSTAQYHLGWMYHNGYGLVIDDVKAANWWARAAEKGSVDAQMSLVLLYREGGVGVSRNLGKAARFLLMAATSGDEEASLLLSHYVDDPEWHLEKRLRKIMRTRPESLGKLVKVVNDGAALREKPSASASVYETVNQGERMVLIARREQWAHAIYLRKRRIIWILAEDLDIDEED